MVVKRHKEIHCDICGKNIGKNTLVPFGMRRVVRIKNYVVNVGGRLEPNSKIDLCWSCYERLIREIKGNTPYSEAVKGGTNG